MNLYVGTSGYSYKEWKGTFYPKDLPDKQMLKFYGERFRSVEINNTFYRMPKPSVLEAWAAEVPPDFKFVLKASQRITHMQRLKDAGDSVAYLLKVAGALKERLGPVLFQLPPFLKKDLARLRDFLALLPAERPAAFEFRNESWQDEEVYAALRAKGAMLCYTDTEEGDSPPVVATAGCGYLRLRRTRYEDADLGDWAERIAALRLERAYVYFMHEDDALGTVFARKLMELWKQRNPK